LILSCSFDYLTGVYCLCHFFRRWNTHRVV